MASTQPDERTERFEGTIQTSPGHESVLDTEPLARSTCLTDMQAYHSINTSPEEVAHARSLSQVGYIDCAAFNTTETDSRGKADL